MGQYDYLIPGNTATAPKSGGQYDYLIPKIPAPLPGLGGGGSFTAPDFSEIQIKPPVFSFAPAPVDLKQPFTSPFSSGATELATNVANQIKDAWQSAFAQGDLGVKQIQSGKGLEGGLNLEAGTAAAFFAPLAPLTNLIGKAIQSLGDSLANIPYMQAYGRDVANNPEPFNASTDPATRLLTAFQNLGAISMGILGAKSGEVKISDIAPEKIVEIAHNPEVLAAAEKVVEAHKEVSKIKPTGQFDNLIPSEKHAAYAKSQGYEPITPTEKLPTIQMGPKAKSSIPTIQANAPKSPELPGYKLEPFKSPIQITPKADETALQVEKPVTRTTQNLKPVEGTGALKTRGLSQNVEATAIEKQLTENFGDLPEFRQVSMKEQAQKAAEIIAKSPEDAKAIAMGEKASPKGVLPESVFVAVEQKAILEGDVQTLKDLANSKLTSSATTMGQRIRTLGERDSASPLAAIQEVQKAREEALAARGPAIKQETITRIRESIRSKNTKESWSDFVKSIQC